MFKAIIAYRIEPNWTRELFAAQDAVATQAFVPCSPSQEKSAGWVSPRGEEHSPLIEFVSSQWIMTFQSESKSIPGAVVRRKVDERCAQIEASTGRKPGKKERKELKEDVTHELLPMALTKISKTFVWIDPLNFRLYVGVPNAARADEIVTALVKSIDGFAVAQINTVAEPSFAMAEWLSEQEPPAGFTIDRECELKATDESKSVVRYAKHALDIDEVRQHIADGKRPTKLAMTWDDRVSFELSQSMTLSKITFLEGTDSAIGKKNHADNFYADVAIATGELGQMFPELLVALGGEAVIGAQGAAE